LSEERNKSALARAMGVSRASLYYRPRQPDKDWAMKVRIEEVLRAHPSYGSRRIADELALERRRVRRVMRLFGIKPYRRHGKRYWKSKIKRTFTNLLLEVMPSYPNHIWVTDFTELIYRGKRVYVSTIIDLFTRRLIGAHVAVRKGTALTVQTLANALLHHPKPAILHSDNGREYERKPSSPFSKNAVSRSRAVSSAAHGRTATRNRSTTSSRWTSAIRTDSKRWANL
jgi:putative transposase